MFLVKDDIHQLSRFFLTISIQEQIPSTKIEMLRNFTTRSAIHQNSRTVLAHLIGDRRDRENIQRRARDDQEIRRLRCLLRLVLEPIRKRITEEHDTGAENLVALLAAGDGSGFRDVADGLGRGEVRLVRVHALGLGEGAVGLDDEGGVDAGFFF